MCGILGVVGIRRPLDDTLYHCFTAGLGLMRGRGPDGYWAYADERALIGQTLLLITDPVSGLRPYVSNDGSIVACVNGEIYNAPELRQTLERCGVGFSSDSDCEVVAHGYVLWKDELFARLDGMFGIGILDRQTGTLTLARDRVGIRPLYYTAQDGYVAFASEPRVLTTAGLATAEPSSEGLFHALVLRRALDPVTMYKEVFSVAPGEQLTFDQAGQKTARLFAALPPQSLASEDDCAPVELEAVRQVVTAAVSRRIPEHCKYSLFLSGGLDSTITNLLTPADPERRLPSMVCGFAFDNTIDERVMAQRAADLLAIKLSSHTVSLERFLTIWPLLVWAHHEPLMFNSSIPLFLLCREARAQGAKVILSGEGADEMFAGYVQYPRYAAEPDDGSLAYLMKYDQEMNAPHFVIENWLSDQAAGSDQWQLLQARLDKALPFKGKQHGLARKLEFDRMTFLRALLMRQDCVGLTTGIEIRVPFLDNRVLHEATRHPAARHLQDGVGKQLLRKAFAPELQELAAVPKVGFPVPVAAWLKYPAFQELCVQLNGQLNTTGFFQHDVILAAMAAGRANGKESYKHLWTLLNFALWWNTRTAPPPPQGPWADFFPLGTHDDAGSMVADTQHAFDRGFLRGQLASHKLPAVVLSKGWRTARVFPLEEFCRVASP